MCDVFFEQQKYIIKPKTQSIKENEHQTHQKLYLPQETYYPYTPKKTLHTPNSQNPPYGKYALENPYTCSFSACCWILNLFIAFETKA